MRRFELVQPNGYVVGNFEVEGPTPELPAGWRDLVEATDSPVTFTFEVNDVRYSAVSILEVK